MPDHEEMAGEPTEREREIAFAPHQSPRRQADGDPGPKPRPELIHDEEEVAGESVDDKDRSQADGDSG